MAKKKHNPNGITFNFSINNIPILSKDDTGDWNIFKKADDHIEEDPNDILGKKNKKETEKFENIAETANKTINSITDILKNE